MQMSLTNNDYDIKVNDQVNELKALLAQDDIIIDQKAIEKAFKFPSFSWENTTLRGKVEYPDPGVGLMHNEFKKEKKVGKKGKGGSPVKKKKK